MKRTDLDALLSFFSHLAFQRDPKPFKRFIAFGVSSRKKSKTKSYSRTSPCGHLSNTDTSLLRTVSHVPTKFSYISS